MRVLITGGSGFIGSFLSHEMSRKGWQVRILDSNDASKGIPELTGFDCIISDILDFHAVLDAMKDVDLVIHLAAKHRFFGISEAEFYRVNVEGTKNILNVASKAGIKNIIFYSSVAVYGDQAAPTDEQTEPQPGTPYGITKLEAEKLIYKWSSEAGGRNALIIRPTVVFGPGNKGNIYRLIRQIDKRLYIPVGNGDNIKSVAYVENLVAATLFLLDKGFKGVEVYNYADEPHMSFKEIVNLVYRLLKRPAPKFALPAKFILIALKPVGFMAKISGITFPVSDAIIKMNKSTHHTARKIRATGFKQMFTLEYGMRQMIEWYKDNKEPKKLQGEEDE